MQEYAWIIALGMFVLTALGVFAGYVVKINKGESAAETAKLALDATRKLEVDLADFKASADTAKAALEAVRKLEVELADFKTEVAKNYASIRLIEQLESRIVNAIERLGDRLDRAFEDRNTHAVPPPRNRPSQD
jgi:hypothetical protein